MCHFPNFTWGAHFSTILQRIYITIDKKTHTVPSRSASRRSSETGSSRISEMIWRRDFATFYINIKRRSNTLDSITLKWSISSDNRLFRLSTTNTSCCASMTLKTEFIMMSSLTVLFKNMVIWNGYKWILVELSVSLEKWICFVFST